MDLTDNQINSDIIKSWISQWESQNLDFKEMFDFSTSGKASFVKDFLAMANTKWWWRLLIWFDDKTLECKWVDKDIVRYDQTKLSDVIKEYSDPMIDFKVIRENYEDKQIIIIFIHEFNKEPILCKKDCGSELSQWKIYHRTIWAASKPIDNSYDMRKLIMLAIEKSKNDMIQSLHRIIAWNPISNVSDFLFEAQINDFKNLFNRKFSEKKPSFEMSFLPKTNVSFDLPLLENHIKKSIFQTSRTDYPLILWYEKKYVSSFW